MNRGKRIRQRREELGLTQAALARKLQKTRSLMSYIEKTGKVNDLTYYEIIRFLGINAETEEDKKVINRFDKLQDGATPYGSQITELEFLRNENAALKEIITLQKSVIALLQSKVDNLR